MSIQIVRKIQRKLISKKNSAGPNETAAQQTAEQTAQKQPATISTTMQDNLDYLKNVLGENRDIVYRRFHLGIKADNEALIIYIENMVNKDLLQNNILKPLMYDSFPQERTGGKSDLRDLLLNSMLAAANVMEEQNLDEIIVALLSGGAVLIVEGLPEAFIIDIRSHLQRAITEPDAEVLVRGPREGFTETLDTNLVLLRRKIISPNLTFDFLNIGRVTATKVAIAYIKDIASPDMLKEVRERLQRIDIDGILESGYLEEFIEDNPYSPFPQMSHSERPDKVAAGLLQGRIAILTEGTPFVLLVPVQLTNFMTSAEDYYERYMIGTVFLWIRQVAFGVTLLLPSLFVAITTFHQEMIPTTLLISLAAYREGVPFTVLIEALIMEFIFEVLREAGTRLPRYVGSAVSIVGALVIGQAAVQAGLVSPLMVIIVATTGIASFTFPAYTLALTLRLLRFPFMLLAGTLGLFGVIFGVIILTIHLAGLRSFGVPYLAPLAPLHITGLKDVLIRAPWWAMDDRPVETSKLNRRRQVPNLKPTPPRENSPSGQQGGG